MEVTGPVCVQQMFATFINFLFHWIKLPKFEKLVGGQEGKEKKKYLIFQKY